MNFKYSKHPNLGNLILTDLKKIVNALYGNTNVVFLAIQTVFEGHDANTYKKMVATQKKYNIKIPFGHDAGDDARSKSNIITNYHTIVTPWFLFIDKHDNVVDSDFYLNPDAAKQFIKTL